MLFRSVSQSRYMQSITDSYYKDVYVEGNWGVYGGVVFSDYIIEDFDYSLDSYENLFMGMDFGYNHASALLHRLHNCSYVIRGTGPSYAVRSAQAYTAVHQAYQFFL